MSILTIYPFNPFNMRLLKKVAKLFFVFPVIAFAQTAEISGKITDAKVNPIEDANVYLRGTVLGSSTDAKGNFVIKNIPSGEFKLVISVIGYKVEEIDVTLTAGQKYEAGMIMLETSALQSEPVVVTASKYEH